MKNIVRYMLAMLLFVSLLSTSFHCLNDSVDLFPPAPKDSTFAPRDPFWSKDGRKILGLSGNLETLGDDFYEVDSAGGVTRLLLSDSLDKGSPVLSPDGSKIAYLAAGYGSLLCCAHVWVMNSDGSNARDLTPGSGSWDHIRWSPDGRFVIFDGGVEDSGAINYQIERADVQTGEVKLLTRARNYGNRDATYLSDGQKIAYLSGRIMTNYGGKVWVMNADGTNPTPIDTSPTASAYPRSSPVNNLLYFFWGLGGESDRGEYSINLDGMTLPTTKSLFRSVYSFAFDDAQWSPDGNLILYRFATSSRTADLYIMNQDGTNIRRLTNGFNILSTSYAWSPDSKRLVFMATPDQYKSINVYVYELSTNALRVVRIKRK